MACRRRSAGRGEWCGRGGGRRRRNVPKSLVTPQSVERVERFLTWKFAGGSAFEEMRARDADAFLTLERSGGRMANGESGGMQSAKVLGRVERRFEGSERSNCTSH